MKHTGKVKFYNEAKGYGFLTNEETGKDIFTHATGLLNKQDGLGIDDVVEYEEAEGKKGLMAINVAKIGY